MKHSIDQHSNVHPTPQFKFSALIEFYLNSSPETDLWITWVTKRSRTFQWFLRAGNLLEGNNLQSLLEQIKIHYALMGDEGGKMPRGSFITRKLSRCQASENRIVIRVFIKLWEKEMRKVVKWNWSEIRLEWGTKDLKLKSSGDVCFTNFLLCFWSQTRNEGNNLRFALNSVIGKILLYF